MNRNTIYGILALIGIAAGTLYWRSCSEKETVARQQAVTTILETTDGKPHERLIGLDSILTVYPEDEMIRRVAVYQMLHAHADLESDSATLVEAANRFLSMDSSGAALSYVSSVYADRGINVVQGLQFANRALHDAKTMTRPDGLTEDQWAEQRRMMIGESEHIRGKLYAWNGRPELALLALRAARDSVPDSPGILHDLALAHETAGHPDSALGAYMDVVRLRYDDADARDAVKRLYPQVYDPYADVQTVLDTLVAHARERRKTKILTNRLDRPAPDFELIGTDGAEYRRDDLKGKAVVMYFWATWCVPCKGQLPVIEEAYGRYSSRRDAVFLTVSIDQRTEAVEPFLRRTGYTFPVAYGDRHVYSGFNLQGLPTLLVLDAEGVIRFLHLGRSDVGDFVEELGWQIDAALESGAAEPEA